MDNLEELMLEIYAVDDQLPEEAREDVKKKLKEIRDESTEIGD